MLFNSRPITRQVTLAADGGRGAVRIIPTRFGDRDRRVSDWRSFTKRTRWANPGDVLAAVGDGWLCGTMRRGLRIRANRRGRATGVREWAMRTRVRRPARAENTLTASRRNDTIYCVWKGTAAVILCAVAYLLRLDWRAGIRPVPLRDWALDDVHCRRYGGCAASPCG